MKLLERLQAALSLHGYYAAHGPEEWDGTPYSDISSDAWSLGYLQCASGAGLFVRLDDTTGFLEFECRSADATYISYNNPTSVSEIGEFDLETDDDEDGEARVATVIALTLFCLGYDLHPLYLVNSGLSVTQHQTLETALRFKEKFPPAYWPTSWKENL